MKPHLPITLCCIDTTDKQELAERALTKCLDQANFADVKFFTHDESRKHAVKIPRLKGRADYSRFVLTELDQHIRTSHFLIVQWDGHVVNANAWKPEFLHCDYLGPYLGDHAGHSVYNGGFSLRSKRLMEAIRRIGLPEFTENGAMEDIWVCVQRRRELEAMGCRIGDRMLASKFAVDGSSVNSGPMNGEFGFHSYCTVLPPHVDGPAIFHHSGDTGDMIYGLIAMQALGGGDLFFSKENHYQYPGATRIQQSGQWESWTANVLPLLLQQDYVWNAHHHWRYPRSTHFDLNAFRAPWKRLRMEDITKPIWKMHLEAFGLDWPEDRPWLTVNDPIWTGRPIVVNRTARYLNDRFPWYGLVQKYGAQMVFIGTPEEHAHFQAMSHPQIIPYYPTANLLEAARVITGAKCFIGNQSSALAIALGLCQNVIVEEWPANPNTRFKRSNVAFYLNQSAIDIPKGWL